MSQSDRNRNPPHRASAQLLLTPRGLAARLRSPRAGSAAERNANPIQSGSDPSQAKLPSDRLPLLIVGLLACCYVIYFASAWFARLPTLHGPLLAKANIASPEAKVSEAATLAPPIVLQQGIDEQDEYDIEVCNYSHAELVYVAIAYFDQHLGDWVARGWYPQAFGECRLVLRNLTGPIFAYGETKDGQSRWGDEGEGQDFCIDAEAGFVLAQSTCVSSVVASPLRSEKRQRFKRLTLSGRGGVHTWELTD